MDTFWWRAAWGLCLVQLSLAQIGECPPGRREGVARVAGTQPAAARAELALGGRSQMGGERLGFGGERGEDLR